VKLAGLAFYWVGNLLVDFFGAERFWQYFLGLIEGMLISKFSILCQRIVLDSFTKIPYMYFLE